MSHRRHFAHMSDERGSTSLMLSWFMLFSLLAAMALDGLLGVYIGLHQGRTAADAAAIATVRAIVTLLPDASEAEAALRVQALTTDPLALLEIEGEVADLEKSQDTCLALAPLCTPLTPEEMAAARRAIRAAAYQRAFSRLYRGVLSAEMASRIADGTWLAGDPIVRRDHLIPDDGDLGCLVYRVVRERRSEVLAKAEALARANGAELDWVRTELGQPQGVHEIVIYRTVRPFGADWIFPDGDYPKLYLPNAAVVEMIGGRTPQYTLSC